MNLHRRTVCNDVLAEKQQAHKNKEETDASDNPNLCSIAGVLTREQLLRGSGKGKERQSEGD